MRTWMYSVLFGMACVTGIAIAVAAVTYNEYANRIESNRATDPGRISKSVEITAFNRENNLVRARMFDSPLQTDEIAFTVNERSIIERRRPLIEDGVVVGLDVPIPATREDITPGRIAFVRLVPDEKGTLWARYVLLDDPLTSVE